MKGTAKRMVDKLIYEKSKGDKTIENGIKVKLILKGINIDKLTATTTDDNNLIDKIRATAKEYGVVV